MLSNRTPPERRPFDGQQDPGHPNFVVDRWLHPSMYTAVPDPACPAGQQWAMRRQAEARLVFIRKAAAARYGNTDYASALQPADSDWPAQVRAAWDSCQRAQTAADELIDASRGPRARLGEGEDDNAWWRAYEAGHDADVAYEEFTAAWDDWQFGHEMPAGPDEPEAGS